VLRKAIERIIQAKNPMTGKYVKVDNYTGRIISRKKTFGPYKNVRIVGVNDSKTKEEGR